MSGRTGYTFAFIYRYCNADSMLTLEPRIADNGGAFVNGNTFTGIQIAHESVLAVGVFITFGFSLASAIHGITNFSIRARYSGTFVDGNTFTRR